MKRRLRLQLTTTRLGDGKSSGASRQLLTALVTPILGLISVIFNMSGSNSYANIAGVLAIVTGAAAALIAGEVWRLHRAAHHAAAEASA